MSVSRWAYIPERCDGDFCVGDCDLCSKTQDNVAMLEGDSNVPDTTVGDMIFRQAAIDVASGYCHPSNIASELTKLSSAQQNRLERAVAGKSPEEIYDFLYWLIFDYARAYTDSRAAVIAWLKGESDE